MGIQATIELFFGEDIIPKSIISLLHDEGWSWSLYNDVTYLEPGDDDFNWKSMPAKEFDFFKFLRLHDSHCPIGLTMATVENIGGDWRVYRRYAVISVNVNRVYLGGSRLVDFGWYLKALAPILATLPVTALKCEEIF